MQRPVGPQSVGEQLLGVNAVRGRRGAHPHVRGQRARDKEETRAVEGKTLSIGDAGVRPWVVGGREGVAFEYGHGRDPVRRRWSVVTNRRSSGGRSTMTAR